MATSLASQPRLLGRILGMLPDLLTCMAIYYLAIAGFKWWSGRRLAAD